MLSQLDALQCQSHNPSISLELISHRECIVNGRLCFPHSAPIDTYSNKPFHLQNLETVLFKHNLKQRPLMSHCYSGGYGSLEPWLFSCRERLQPAITHAVAKEVFSQAGGRLHCWHRARTHLAGPQISICVSVCVCAR